MVKIYVCGFSGKILRKCKCENGCFRVTCDKKIYEKIRREEGLRMIKAMLFHKTRPNRRDNSYRLDLL